MTVQVEVRLSGREIGIDEREGRRMGNSGVNLSKVHLYANVTVSQ